MPLHPIASRTSAIGDALARCLNRGDFEVVTIDGERFLRPILAGHVMQDAIWTVPLLSLDLAARDIERLLS